MPFTLDRKEKKHQKETEEEYKIQYILYTSLFFIPSFSRVLKIKTHSIILDQRLSIITKYDPLPAAPMV